MTQDCTCGRYTDDCGCAKGPTPAPTTPEFRIGDEFDVRVRLTRVAGGGLASANSHSNVFHFWTPEELRAARRVERPLAVGDRIVNVVNVYDKFGKVIAIDGEKTWVRYDSSKADALEYTVNLRRA